MKIPVPRIRPTTLLPLVTAALLAASHAPTHAADGTWNGGGGSGDRDWTSTTNWVGGSVPSATTDAATFGTDAVLANRTVTLDSAQSINWLAVGTTATGYVFNGSQLTLNSNLGGSSTAALRVGGASVTTFHNAVHFAGATATMDLQFSGTSTFGHLVFEGPVTTAGNLATLQRGYESNSTPSNMIFNGNVNLNSGAGSLNLNGGSLTTTFSGSNSWSTLTQQGANSTLRLASDGALSSGSTLVSAIGINDSTVRIESVGAARTYAANLTLNSEGSMNRSITFQGGNDLAFTGTTYIQRDAVINVDGAIRVGLTGNWTSVSARFVTKQGTGTLVMGSGGTTTVDHTLGTTINGGTLLVNGNLGNAAGTDDVVTVNNDATLGGTGFIVRETTVNNGGMINPGDSAVNNGIGTLTFSTGGGNLILNDGARLVFELNGTGTTNDLLITNGGFNLGSGNTFTFDFSNLNLGSYAANTWTTIWTNSTSWGTQFSDNTFSIGALSGGLSGGEFQLSGNDLQVRFTAIPEPETWAFLALAMTLIVAFRRRRRA